MKKNLATKAMAAAIGLMAGRERQDSMASACNIKRRVRLYENIITKRTTLNDRKSRRYVNDARIIMYKGWQKLVLR